MRIRIVAGMLFIVLCASSALAEPMNGDEIKTEIIGKTGKWASKDGKLSGTVIYETDGSASITGNFPKFKTDVGKWRISKNRFCAQWKKIRQGEERCFNFETTGQNSYVDDNGTSLKF